MGFRQVILVFFGTLLLTLAAFGGEAKPGVHVYPLKYEGGTLPLKQNHAVRAVVTHNEVVFVQHGQRFVVPFAKIQGISCAMDAHRRFGAPVLGLVPIVDLDKVEDYYVGMTWGDDAPGGGHSTMEVVFKLNAGEYRDFVSTLERLTGKKAIDTHKTPTVVRYAL